MYLFYVAFEYLLNGAMSCA